MEETFNVFVFFFFGEYNFISLFFFKLHIFKHSIISINNGRSIFRFEYCKIYKSYEETINFYRILWNNFFIRRMIEKMIFTLYPLTKK